MKMKRPKTFNEILKNCLEEKELDEGLFVPDDFYVYSDIRMFLENIRKKIKNNGGVSNIEELKRIINESREFVKKAISLSFNKIDPESEEEIRERENNFEISSNKIKNYLLEEFNRYKIELENRTLEDKKKRSLKYLKEIKNKLFKE